MTNIIWPDYWLQFGKWPAYIFVQDILKITVFLSLFFLFPSLWLSMEFVVTSHTCT